MSHELIFFQKALALIKIYAIMDPVNSSETRHQVIDVTAQRVGIMENIVT